jgi:4-hydroxy-3-polyprenylbenzoate decarboxylase
VHINKMSMAFNGLNSFVERLEKEDELIRISDFFDPELEITEVTDRFSKLNDGGKALLFENNGTKFPLLINSMGSDKRICEALNFTDIEQPIKDISQILRVFGTKPDSIWDKIKSLKKRLHVRKIY